MTKAAYGAKLEDNLTDLLARIRREGYKPQASRIVEIPKEDGSTRPLAISCFEDKIVQLAVAKILTAIYEPIFLPCSYGYRPGISAHDALRSLMRHSNKNLDGYTVEIDLRKYFDSIPHEMLCDILAQKITEQPAMLHILWSESLHTANFSFTQLAYPTHVKATTYVLLGRKSHCALEGDRPDSASNQSGEQMWRFEH